jgi:hypothetical protein
METITEENTIVEPVEPVVEAVVEPVVEPVEPTEPVVEPVEPTEPVVEPTEPVEPVEPVVEPVSVDLLSRSLQTLSLHKMSSIIHPIKKKTIVKNYRNVWFKMSG